MCESVSAGKKKKDLEKLENRSSVMHDSTEKSTGKICPKSWKNRSQLEDRNRLIYLEMGS